MNSASPSLLVRVKSTASAEGECVTQSILIGLAKDPSKSASAVLSTRLS
jgi:hypothetical protein